MSSLEGRCCICSQEGNSWQHGEKNGKKKKMRVCWRAACHAKARQFLERTGWRL